MSAEQPGTGNDGQGDGEGGGEAPKKRKLGRPRLPAPGEDDSRLRRSRRNPIFGKKVRRLRVEQELSQADLAKAFKDRGFHEIDNWSIGRLERGTQTPMTSEIAAYADFFDVDIDWLVRDELLNSQRSRSYQTAISIMRNLTPNEAARRLQGLAPDYGAGSPRPVKPVYPNSEAVKPKKGKAGGNGSA